jgi:hypothetical protein
MKIHELCDLFDAVSERFFVSVIKLIGWLAVLILVISAFVASL